jgi:hypothetical protein
VLANSKTEGCWFAFGMSILDGYHSVLLLVDHTAAAAKMYWLDQFSGGLDDDITNCLDQFVGTRMLRKQVKLPEFGEVWFAGIEQCIPPGYMYGLKP